MKYPLILILFTALLFVQCSRDYSTVFNNTLFSHVGEAEKIMEVYDKSVGEAFSTENYADITELSQKALVAITRKKQEISALNGDKELQTMKDAALSYIDAMINMIKAEQVYASYTPELTLEDVKLMDQKSILAKKVLSERYEYLMEAQALVRMKDFGSADTNK